MFDLMAGPPDDWEPIPDEILAELGALGDEGLPAGMTAEYADSPDRLVERAVEIGPSATSLALLTVVPPAVLSDQAQAEALAALTGITAHVASVSHDFAAAIAGPKPATPTLGRDDYAAHEVGVATRSSVYAADSMISLARDLATVLRASRDAMREGRLTLAQARALHTATAGLPASVARDIEARVLKRSAHQSLKNFNACLNRACAALDPDYTKKATAARTEVEVTHTAYGDGVGRLTIQGPLELTTTIHMAMTAFAARHRSELGGTAAQRKLAGLAEMAEAYLASPDVPTHHGRSAIIDIVIDLTTFLGLTNHPAEIRGVGPVPAEVARWFAADGAPLRRLITDPMTGELLDYGRTTYPVPPDLADYLIAKNGTAASPHSDVEARVADMDHNLPYDDGGATDPVNTTPIDRRWHRAKTFGGWTYTKHDDGSVTWRSPRGQTCRVEPHDYRLGP